MVNSSAVDARTLQRHAPWSARHKALTVGLVAASALVVGVGVGPAGALQRLPGPWHHDTEGELSENADREHLSDDEACVMPAVPAPTTTAPAAVGGSSLSQTITVVVPPLVRVQSTTDGVIRVISNAARPPAPGDLVYVQQANGDYASADQGLVARVLSARWVDGSWCSTTAVHRSVG